MANINRTYKMPAAQAKASKVGLNGHGPVPQKTTVSGGRANPKKTKRGGY